MHREWKWSGNVLVFDMLVWSEPFFRVQTPITFTPLYLETRVRCMPSKIFHHFPTPNFPIFISYLLLFFLLNLRRKKKPPIKYIKWKKEKKKKNLQIYLEIVCYYYYYLLFSSIFFNNMKNHGLAVCINIVKILHWNSHIQSHP